MQFCHANELDAMAFRSGGCCASVAVRAGCAYARHRSTRDAGAISSVRPRCLSPHRLKSTYKEQKPCVILVCNVAFYGTMQVM